MPPSADEAVVTSDFARSSHHCVVGTQAGHLQLVFAVTLLQQRVFRRVVAHEVEIGMSEIGLEAKYNNIFRNELGDNVLTGSNNESILLFHSQVKVNALLPFKGSGPHPVTATQATASNTHWACPICLHERQGQHTGDWHYLHDCKHKPAGYTPCFTAIARR